MAELFSFPVRIDKYLAHCGYGTRKSVRRMIRAGVVELNNEKITRESVKVREGDVVSVEGQTVTEYRNHYWMFHKPAGVICSNSDTRSGTVFDLIDHPLKPFMQIAGRLDKDVTGLVLISTDGQFTHRIISPKSHLPRTYHATLAANLTDGQENRLKQGIEFSEYGVIKFTSVRALKENVAELVIHSGQYHIVKRMLAAVGAELLQLHRIAVGNLYLDEKLPHGGLRELSAREMDHLFK